MTSVPRQLAIFAAVLAVLFAGGYAAGQIMGPMKSDHDSGASSHSMSSMESSHGGHSMEPAQAHGLGASENGLRLTVDAHGLREGESGTVAFRILDSDGSPVRDYDVEHTKRMHMIVVRRDLTDFQHLHPTQDGAGVWSARRTFHAPGDYRLFADSPTTAPRARSPVTCECPEPTARGSCPPRLPVP